MVSRTDETSLIRHDDYIWSTMTDDYSPVTHETLDIGGLKSLVFAPFSNHAFRGHGISERRLVPTAYRGSGRETLLRMMEGYIKYHGMAANDSEDLDIEVLEMANLRIFHELCNAQGLPVPDLGSTTNNPLTEARNEILVQGRKGVWMDCMWLEVACLAQHYGVPTRLLDWTTDINAALHFAAISALRHMDDNPDGTFCVWVLDTDAAKTVMGDLEVVRPDYSRNPNMRAQSGVMTFSWKRTSDQLRVPFDVQLQEAFDAWVREADADAKEAVLRRPPVLRRFDIPYGLLDDLARYLSSHRYDSSRYVPGYEGAYRCMRECMDYSKLPDRTL